MSETLFMWIHAPFRNTMMGVSTGMNQALIGSNPLATMQGKRVCLRCVRFQCADHPLWSPFPKTTSHFTLHPLCLKFIFLSKPQVTVASGARSSSAQSFWISQYGERFNFILIQCPAIITDWQGPLMAELRRPSQLTANSWTDTIRTLTILRPVG